MCGDQAFGRVEHVDGVAAVAGHHGHADARSSVQLVRAGLGGRHAELALQLGDHGTDHRPLLFERSHVAEQHVELEPADPHPAGQRGGVGAGRRAPGGAAPGSGGGWQRAVSSSAVDVAQGQQHFRGPPG